MSTPDEISGCSPWHFDLRITGSDGKSLGEVVHWGMLSASTKTALSSVVK